MAHSVVRCIAALTVAIGVTADMPNGFSEVKSSKRELPFCLVLTAYGIAGKKAKPSEDFTLEQ
jgi:hypothetical protein